MQDECVPALRVSLRGKRFALLERDVQRSELLRQLAEEASPDEIVPLPANNELTPETFAWWLAMHDGDGFTLVATVTMLKV